MKKLSTLLFLFVILGSHAQVSNSKTLANWLTQIESQYGVKFSYNPKIIKDQSVSIDLSDAKLIDVLTLIEDQTPFYFKKVNDRYYTVKLRTKTSLCGYVYDLNNKPIQGAAITYANNTTGTTTDDQGYFSIKEIKLIDSFTISYLGFESIVVSAKDISRKSCDTYYLKEEVFLLNEVVIKEYLGLGISRVSDGSIQINPNNLEVLSGLAEPDILQNIQLLPGIDSPTETSSGIYIRGGTPDQNLILWDDIKMYNVDHFFGMISALNPYITKSVNVYRSGTKAKYGDRVSGVIDIKTDDQVPDKTSGAFGLNMTHADLFLKQPLSKKTAVIISGRRSITDIINTPTFDQFSKRVFQNTSIDQNQQFFNGESSTNTEDFYFNDLTLKVITNPTTKSKLSVSTIATRNELDYTFGDQFTPDIFSDKLKVSNLGGVIAWDHQWSDRFSTKSNISLSQFDLDYNGIIRFSSDDRILKKENNISEVSASFQAKFDISKNMTLNSGYQFTNNEILFLLEDNEFITEDNNHNNSHALYAQFEYLTTNKWRFETGLRANHFSTVNKTYFEPRLYIEKELSTSARLKASAELKNQSISQVLEFTTLNFGLENQLWILADESDFPVLNSNQFSTGFLFNNKGWAIDIDLYYKQIQGLTSLTRGFESNVSTFDSGDSKTTGIDFLIKKKVQNYTSWLGYSYANTNFKFPNINNGNSFDGNNDITHSLTWSHSYTLDKFQFSLSWRYRSGIPFTNALGIDQENQFINYSAPNSNRLPDYHRLDFSTVYTFPLSKKTSNFKAKIGASFLNLYNQENLLKKEFVLFQITDDTGSTSLEIQEINQLSLGFTPNVFFRIQF